MLILRSVESGGKSCATSFAVHLFMESLEGVSKSPVCSASYKRREVVLWPS